LVHTTTHTHAHTSTQNETRTHTCSCTHTHRHTHEHTHEHTHTHTHAHTHTCTRTHAHTHTNTNTHEHLQYSHRVTAKTYTHTGAGETEKSVGTALKTLKKTSTRQIPLADPHHVIKETCRLYLQDLTLSYEQYACSTVDFLKRRLMTCGADTLGAVALVYAASVASGVCDNAMCQRVAETSGLAESTLRQHVQTALPPPLSSHLA